MAPSQSISTIEVATGHIKGNHLEVSFEAAGDGTMGSVLLDGLPLRRARAIEIRLDRCQPPQIIITFLD